MPALILLSGPLSGQRIEVDREIVIGREGVDLVLEDPEVSRRHVAVRPREGGVEVEDLGSRNGTRVDGTPVGAPITLNRDANIELGGTKIQLSVGVQEQATQVAQAAVPAADPHATKVGAPSPAPLQKDPAPAAAAAAPPPPQAAPQAPPPQAPPPQAAPPQAPPPQAAPPIPQGAPPGAQFAPPPPNFSPVPVPSSAPAFSGAGGGAARGKRKRGTASRTASGVAFTAIMVALTTAALILYFLTR